MRVLRQDALLEQPLRRALAPVARPVDELDPGPQPAAADLLDGVEVRRPAAPGCRYAPSRAERSWNSPVRSIATTRRPIAHASGLPPNVLPCSPGLEDAEHVLVGDDRGHRHDPAAERLAEDEHVGPDALVLARERRPGAAEARLDLVGDEQHAALGAELAGRGAGSPRAGRRRRPRPGSARRGTPTVSSSIAASSASASPYGTTSNPGVNGPKSVVEASSVEKLTIVIVRPWKLPPADDRSSRGRARRP